MAKSTKGTKVCITKGSATSTETTPTAITKAAPAIVTATTTGVLEGDLVYISGTGMTSIDGKVWPVKSVTATEYALVGSDTTADGTFTSASASAKHYAAADMVCICASSVSESADTPQAVSVATFCDPSATIAGASASAGTLDISGYADINDTDYAELVKAVEDGKLRYIRIAYPDNGYRVAGLTFSSITYETPLDGALGYTAQAVLSSSLKHIW